VSERDGYEAGVPCGVDTWQHDAEAAVAFYTSLFGWDVEDTMPPGIPGQHFMCRLRGRDIAAIASRPEGAPPETAWTTYVWVDSADDAAAKVVATGGSVIKRPFESLDGGRLAIVADPAGAVFGVWQPGTHKGAQLVNEPGAWAMSMLNTGDVEGAKRFYRELFGWETETFDAGGTELTLWRLPGYVGGEPEQPVPRDVVAAMAPLPAAAAAPHWSINFWADDVDAIAATAAAHGGSVVAMPTDGPGFREAVVADPEGARLSVSQLIAAP
jgi:uncharacterized protein